MRLRSRSGVLAARVTSESRTQDEGLSRISFLEARHPIRRALAILICGCVSWACEVCEWRKEIGRPNSGSGGPAWFEGSASACWSA